MCFYSQTGWFEYFRNNKDFNIFQLFLRVYREWSKKEERKNIQWPEVFELIARQQQVK